MFDLTKILAVVDPDTEVQLAIDKATMLAKLAGAELQLFMADYSRYLEDGYFFDPVRANELRHQHREKHLKDLEKIAEQIRAQGVEVSVSYAWGNPPYEEIVRRVNKEKPSLVIKSSQSHTKIARTLLSNRDWDLVRHCPAPLLLVKVGNWGAKPVFIASVDPNHVHDKPAALDHKLVDIAQTLARTTAGDVHLFHSTKLPSLAGMYPLSADYEYDLENVNKLALKHSLSEKQCHLSEQDIGKSLPELVANLDAGVVVMGAISRSKLDRVLIGNSAEKVIDKLWSDVLLVKPDPREKLLL